MLDANDLTLMALVLRLNDPIEALVNPLMVVVLEIFGQDMAQLVFGRERILSCRSPHSMFPALWRCASARAM